MATNKFGSIEDLIGLSDSEDSSSSSTDNGVFDNQQPLILELHELKKDDPKSENLPPEVKAKKNKKKKKTRPKSHISMTSESQSEGGSVPPVMDTTEDEFYDAHESYHALSGSHVPKPVTAAVGLVQAHSEHSQDPKASPAPPVSPSAQHTGPPKAPSTISFQKQKEQNASKRLILKSKFPAMEKAAARYKSKTKKPAPKPKTSKKRKTDGPTCSMFLAEITRKLASKRRQEQEAPKNIVQTIIESITNALPVKLSKRPSPEKKLENPPMQMESLQILAPELMPNDIINIPNASTYDDDDVTMEEVETAPQKPPAFKMPKMPLVSSDVLKVALQERKKKIPMQDESVNTSSERDVASELAKHVNTLRKISLIAEEFNQKTARNLKEIVDSVQEDLIKKLEEVQAEQKAKSEILQIKEEQEDPTADD